MTTAGRAWGLWVDWCAATGTDPWAPAPETLVRYAAQVRCVDRADLRRDAARLGLSGWPDAASDTDPWAAVDRLLVSAEESVRRCPPTGWPHGYRGRRDAALVVLVRERRMTRRAVVDLDWAGFEALAAAAGDSWGRRDDPLTCRPCVLRRWAEVLVGESRAFRAGAMVAVGQLPVRHVCADPWPWATEPVQVPVFAAIDRHGYASARAMTTRAVTAVIALRGDPLLEPWDPGQSPGRALHPAREWDPATLDRLDEACRSADEVNARVARFLDEAEKHFDAQRGTTSGHRIVV